MGIVTTTNASENQTNFRFGYTKGFGHKLSNLRCPLQYSKIVKEIFCVVADFGPMLDVLEDMGTLAEFQFSYFSEVSVPVR